VEGFFYFLCTRRFGVYVAVAEELHGGLALAGDGARAAVARQCFGGHGAREAQVRMCACGGRRWVGQKRCCYVARFITPQNIKTLRFVVCCGLVLARSRKSVFSICTRKEFLLRFCVLPSRYKRTAPMATAAATRCLPRPASPWTGARARSCKDEEQRPPGVEQRTLGFAPKPHNFSRL